MGPRYRKIQADRRAHALARYTPPAWSKARTRDRSAAPPLRTPRDGRQPGPVLGDHADRPALRAALRGARPARGVDRRVRGRDPDGVVQERHRGPGQGHDQDPPQARRGLRRASGPALRGGLDPARARGRAVRRSRRPRRLDRLRRLPSDRDPRARRSGHARAAARRWRGARRRPTGRTVRAGRRARRATRALDQPDADRAEPAPGLRRRRRGHLAHGHDRRAALALARGVSPAVPPRRGPGGAPRLTGEPVHDGVERRAWARKQARGDRAGSRPA